MKTTVTISLEEYNELQKYKETVNLKKTLFSTPLFPIGVYTTDEAVEELTKRLDMTLKEYDNSRIELRKKNGEIESLKQELLIEKEKPKSRFKIFGSKK